MKLENVVASKKSKRTYRDGNKWIKTFDENSKVDVLAQALNHALIEETSIKIPKMLEVTTSEGNYTIITEYVNGQSIQDLMDKNPEKIDEYIEMFVNIQMSIHMVRAPGLKKLKDKMSAKISMSELDETLKYDLHTRLFSMPKHYKVCHGDLKPSRVIVTNDNEVYITDWAHVTQGNASADISRTYLTFCLEGKTELAEKYLDLFCQKSGTTKKYVQRWFPIVAASQTVKKNPHETELLMKWVDVVEGE